ncbi:glycosyltransferase [uncultured Sphaerochaeta sp.]|uniref:glycosyltransferase n=1 Tax=uncultured Sphaerochaeta sp. TaxID=886478 RepID=UPI002A0A49EC|nr:glycosyltransferase [uncultured Sphaerochaeta sp.]
MKILITTEFYFPIITGVATVLKNQRETLRAQGHEVRILVIGPERRTFFEDDIYHIKASRIRLYPDSYNTFWFHDPILKEILAWNPQVVHSNGEFFSMVFARQIVKKLSIPLIHTCHTDFPTYGENYIKNKKVWNFVIARVLRARLRLVDCIISPSLKNKNMLRGYGISKPIEVIPSGIEISRFSQPFSEKERSDLRSAFSFSDEHFVFVSICRLAAEKNIKETIAHFASLVSLRPQARLLIVGGGPEQENLENQVRKLHLDQLVRFSGSIDPLVVWKYYRIGDVFVTSSTSETQPMISIEAISSGVPLLCRKDDSLELTLEEGNNGYSFISDEDFIEHGVALIDDHFLWERLHLNALEGSKKFSREVWCDRLLSLYNSYIGK